MIKSGEGGNLALQMRLGLTILKWQQRNDSRVSHVWNKSHKSSQASYVIIDRISSVIYN